MRPQQSTFSVWIVLEQVAVLERVATSQSVRRVRARAISQTVR